MNRIQIQFYVMVLRLLRVIAWHHVEANWPEGPFSQQREMQRDTLKDARDLEEKLEHKIQFVNL